MVNQTTLEAFLNFANDRCVRLAKDTRMNEVVTKVEEGGREPYGRFVRYVEAVCACRSLAALVRKETDTTLLGFRRTMDDVETTGTFSKGLGRAYDETDAAEFPSEVCKTMSTIRAMNVTKPKPYEFTYGHVCSCFRAMRTWIKDRPEPITDQHETYVAFLDLFFFPYVEEKFRMTRDEIRESAYEGFKKERKSSTTTCKRRSET